MRRKVLVTLMVILMVVAFSMPAFAASFTVSWTAPTTNEDGTPLTDLAGFRVYYGSMAGVYGTTVDVGNVLTYQQQVGDVDGLSVFAVVTAYDTSGNESLPSNEVSLTFPMIAPSPPVLTGVVD